MQNSKGQDLSPSCFTNDEWAELQKGLPLVEEPAIHRYILGREELIEQEKQQRSDRSFRQSCSPLAIEACEIVERIRQDEQRTIWSSRLDDNNENIYPGMMFIKAKEKMENTTLWKILRRMPKGALLHAHLDAMVDLDFLFEALMSTPGMHMQSTVALSDPASLETSQIKFRFLKVGVETDLSIWSANYVPDHPIPVTKVADSFPLHGRSGFLAWLRDRCSITASESTEHQQGVDAVWRKFRSIFVILDSILFYEPIFRRVIRQILTLLRADGVLWVDFRLAFTFRYYREDQEQEDSDFNHLFIVLDEEIAKFQSSEDGTGFWGARVIWTTLRSLETRKVVEDMDACITMKMTYPHLIAGYDLVGQEDAGRPLKDLLPELFWFKKQCAQEGVEIPFFFHAGECLGDGTDTDQNLFDAVLLGTRRIGHGFSLYKHPLLTDLVRDRMILVESCPISNEVLRLCASISAHPLPALIARGVACSLSNDDPTILGQNTAGLTHDFWQALQGWDNLGLAGLASLAENSVRWAAFEDENATAWLKGVTNPSLGDGVRAQRLRQWQVDWEQFCLWIVTEFGSTSLE